MCGYLVNVTKITAHVYDLKDNGNPKKCLYLEVVL